MAAPSGDGLFLMRAIAAVVLVAVAPGLGAPGRVYVTELGRRAVITGLKLRELFVLPHLVASVPTTAATSRALLISGGGSRPFTQPFLRLQS